MPDIAAAAADIALAQASLDSALARLATTDTAPAVWVNAGDNLQAMIDNEPSGTTFRIKPDWTGGDLTVRKPVTLQHHGIDELPLARIANETVLPTIRGQIFTDAPCVLQGIGIDGDPARSGITLIVNQVDGGVVFDRVRARGSASGQRRGMWLAAPNVSLHRSTITNIWYANETQAILTERDGHNLLVDDCLLQASSMPFMAGGGDCWSPWRIPHNLTFRRTEFSRPPEWRGRTDMAQAKNWFELKAAIGVRVEQCLFRYNWHGGQNGHGISIGVRNQYNRDPWNTVEDVEFIDCVADHTSGLFIILGRDYTNPSDVIRRIRISKFTCTDLSAASWGGLGRVVELQGGGYDLTFEDLVVTKGAGGTNSFLQFTNPLYPFTRFVAKNWDVPEGTYGAAHDGTGWNNTSATPPTPAPPVRGTQTINYFLPGATWQNVTLRRPAGNVNWQYPAGTTVVPA